MICSIRYRSISDVILKILAIEKLRVEKSSGNYLVLYYLIKHY